MEKTIPYKENPAKAFLRRYRALLLRCDALSEAIQEAHERATNRTVRPNPNKVQSSGGAYDRMAEDACKAADAEILLEQEMEKVRAAISEILAAIDAVPDEMQKTILTMRYINGKSWEDIGDRIGYERTQTLVYHGRALLTVKRNLNKSADENGHHDKV